MKIGEMLVGNGIISRDQLEEAIKIQKKNGGFLGMILVELKYLDPDILSTYLKAQKK